MQSGSASTAGPARAGAYRPDIDGLRAIAVLSVLVYHAEERLLPGGFTGVDIFFVISGYLITGLIVPGAAAGTFSLSEFYVRRARRILPAMFVMLVATLIAGVFLLTPGELRELGRTATATVTFASNIAFWLGTGYFDTASVRKPLLHTWTLALEEQFYLLWPVLLVAAYRWRMPVRRAALVGIALSFAASCFLAVVQPPTAFFLLPSRAWQLLVGAALALGVLAPLRSRTREASAWVGLALMVAGFVLLDRTSAFPGWNALLPTLGAALLIHAGQSGSHAVARHLLTARPLVGIGLISYSLYLWHWPLLVFTRIVERNAVAPTHLVIVVLFTFIPAVLSWRFVERPFRAGPGRTKDTARSWPVLTRYGLASAFIGVVGLGLYQTNGLYAWASPNVLRAEKARYDVNPKSGTCLRWQSQEGALPGPECTSGTETAPRLVVWGDSHADSVAPGFAEAAAARGLATYQLTMAACPPLAGVEVVGDGADYSPCIAFNRQVLASIVSDTRVRAVALAARWPVYVLNSRFGPDDSGAVSYLLDETDRERSSTTSGQVFRRGLEDTVAALRDAGKLVILLGSIPAQGVNVPECLARNHMPLSRVDDCDVDINLVMPRLYNVDAQITELARQRGVCAYLPREVLCRGGECLVEQDGHIMYANDDHLTTYGALYLARTLNVLECLETEGSDEGR